MPKICEYETCRAYANYGEFYGKPLRCKEHKGDYKLVSSLCKNGNCNIRPCYNIEGKSKGLYCALHKLDGMTNVINKKCIHPNCNKNPVYNVEGETKGLYCLLHKLDDMIDIINKKCIHNNCKKQPNYNVEGETKGLYCSEHKLDGMIDVINKKCIHPNCKKIPLYNTEGKTKGLYCSAHKMDGMIDVINKLCIHPNCKTQSNYNIEGETKALYCSEHKLDGMVDIRNKTCLHPNCNTRPLYNIQGEKKGLYCSIHKLDGMIDIINKKCIGNFCLGTLANPKYKGYCSSCYKNLFPSDPLTLQMRSKTKEIAIRDFINLNFEGFQHDNPLWSGNCECTHRRRIDHRKLIGNTLLCIETDEEQHKGYDKDDEEIRYDDLYMLHSAKFIFIRFNPDKFKNKEGKSVNLMLYNRLPVLKQEIEKQIKRIENEENTELLEIIKLYYDEIKN
jgi:hypothetical protein